MTLDGFPTLVMLITVLLRQRARSCICKFSTVVLVYILFFQAEGKDIACVQCREGGLNGLAGKRARRGRGAAAAR